MRTRDARTRSREGRRALQLLDKMLLRALNENKPGPTVSRSIPSRCLSFQILTFICGHLPLFDLAIHFVFLTSSLSIYIYIYLHLFLPPRLSNYICCNRPGQSTGCRAQDTPRYPRHDGRCHMHTRARTHTDILCRHRSKTCQVRTR